MPFSKKEEKLITEHGLIPRLVYRCIRCNYCWLPRDYDLAYDEIIKMEPPKSCARCKSKYWRKIPQRRTLNFSGPNSTIRSMRLVISGKERIPGVKYPEPKAEAKTETHIKTKVKTPISSQIQLKPYKPPTGKRAVDIWQNVSICTSCNKQENKENRDGMLFAHKYKRYYDGWIVENLHLKSKGENEVMFDLCSGNEYAGSVSFVQYFSLAGRGTDMRSMPEKIRQSETEKRRIYWQTHTVPRDKIDKAINDRNDYMKVVA